MKHKTAELTGALLDAAVAQADGRLLNGLESWDEITEEPFQPSINWHHGGPIIERKGINLRGRHMASDPMGFQDWCARISSSDFFGRGDAVGRGPTPLIAAMRAFVAAKLGEEVELP